MKHFASSMPDAIRVLPTDATAGFTCSESGIRWDTATYNRLLAYGGVSNRLKGKNRARMVDDRQLLVYTIAVESRERFSIRSCFEWHNP